jgi:ubiquitin-protein ligase
LAKNGHQIFRLSQVEIKDNIFKEFFLIFIQIVLLQIIELLADPSTESPVVPAIAQQILKNPQEFYETARKYTAAHAQPKELQ